MLICDFILELFAGIPFEILSEIIHVNSYNKSLELIVGILKEVVPNILAIIIISSIMFGAMHLNIFQFVNATIGGLFLGVIYYKTRSLVLCIVAHMINNLIPILDIQRNIISFFIGAIIFIIAAIFFQKYIKELKYIDINSQENSVSSNI
ncbi:CPBP family intramembrane metalloprotease [Clostridium botulinum]|nr:CPBP family intramembrane metalloprotease [Clostridium botulinum]EKO2042320.1 CPBP family intramembrane metalloprotease [Clostridium botulinum]